MAKLYWKSNKLAYITKLMLTGRLYGDTWQVEECLGKDIYNNPVEVELPFVQLCRGELKPQIMQYGRDENIYIKDIGILNVITTKIVEGTGFHTVPELNLEVRRDGKLYVNGGSMVFDNSVELINYIKDYYNGA